MTEREALLAGLKILYQSAADMTEEQLGQLLDATGYTEAELLEVITAAVAYSVKNNESNIIRIYKNIGQAADAVTLPEAQRDILRDVGNNLNVITFVEEPDPDIALRAAFDKSPLGVSLRSQRLTGDEEYAAIKTAWKSADLPEDQFDSFLTTRGNAIVAEAEQANLTKRRLEAEATREKREKREEEAAKAAQTRRTAEISIGFVNQMDDDDIDELEARVKRASKRFVDAFGRPLTPGEIEFIFEQEMDKFLEEPIKGTEDRPAAFRISREETLTDPALAGQREKDFREQQAPGRPPQAPGGPAFTADIEEDQATQFAAFLKARGETVATEENVATFQEALIGFNDENRQRSGRRDEATAFAQAQEATRDTQGGQPPSFTGVPAISTKTDAEILSEKAMAQGIAPSEILFGGDAAPISFSAFITQTDQFRKKNPVHIRKQTPKVSFA